MTTPNVRDPKPLADSLIRYTEDDPTPTSLLAVAVRAALHECAEQQALAVNLLDRATNPLSQGLYHGWLESANKVVRRVTEALERLPQAKDETVPMADIEAWLKAQREMYRTSPSDGSDGRTVTWWAIDGMLDDLREHVQTGTPLNGDARR